MWESGDRETEQCLRRLLHCFLPHLRQAEGLDSELLAVVLDLPARSVQPSQHLVVDVLEVKDRQPVLGQLALSTWSVMFGSTIREGK